MLGTYSICFIYDTHNIYIYIYIYIYILYVYIYENVYVYLHVYIYIHFPYGSRFLTTFHGTTACHWLAEIPQAILTFRWGGLNEIIAPAQWGETGGGGVRPGGWWLVRKGLLTNLCMLYIYRHLPFSLYIYIYLSLHPDLYLSYIDWGLPEIQELGIMFLTKLD